MERRDLLVVDGRLGFDDGSDGVDGREVETLDLTGHLVFPGLVNAHDHLLLNALSPPEPIPVQESLYAWSDAFQPYFADPRFVAAKALPAELRAWHGGFKNLLAGTTVVAHHDPWCDAFDDPDFPVRVPRDHGWCHSLRYAGSYGPDVGTSFRATPPDRPWFIHLAEGTDDVAAGELSALAALSCLDARTVIVHGVGLTERDVDLVVARGAAVVWCPSSNLTTLGRTLAPAVVRRLFDAGRLALGTDSRFTGSRDLIEELKVARASSDLLPRELLALVTTHGADVLRLPDGGTGFFAIADGGGDPYEALLSASRESIVVARA